MGNLLTISEATEKYHVTRKTLYNWRRDGKVGFEENSGKVLILEDSIKSLAPLRAAKNEGVITQDLHAKIDTLTEKITQLERVITQLNSRVINAIDNSTEKERVITHKKVEGDNYHSNRAQIAIEKARTAYLELSEELGRQPQKQEVAERAGIARGTARKYWSEITSSSSVE